MALHDFSAGRQHWPRSLRLGRQRVPYLPELLEDGIQLLRPQAHPAVLHLHDAVAVLAARPNVVARRVTRDGQPVHLTPREYTLLAVLATNADRVLTHGYLLRAVFARGYEDAGANLRVLIGQLRRKIERDPGHLELLITEAGAGYRLRLDV